MRTLITGGAGFIGSNLCQALLDSGESLTVLDNFSSGFQRNVRNLRSRISVNVLRGDCKNRKDVKHALEDVGKVFHLAANPEVRLDLSDPSTSFRENVYATHILLEELRGTDVDTIVYASSSTVYGDARLLPTPENYGPLEPTSFYGASKLASEGLVSAFCHTYGVTGVILRLANIVGSASGHGIIRDFLSQLRNNPEKLRIQGDGHQIKSYLHIDDCISGILCSFKSSSKGLNVFNVGSADQLDAKTIAGIVQSEAGFASLPIESVGGTRDGRGWKGDVKNMLLDISKLRSKGWQPKYSSEEAVRIATRSELSKELSPLP